MEDKHYKGNLDLREVISQMLKHDTDNCKLTYTHGDLEFKIDVTIIKISKGGKVEYDIDGEEDGRG
jgi:hypothetical protein